MTLPDPYDELVFKFLNETITTDEQKALDGWLQQSPENDRIFRHYVSIWKSANTNGSPTDFQTAEEWKKLEQIVAGKSKVVRLSYWKNITKMAAAVALLIAASFSIYQYLKNDVVEIVSREERMQIVLPDGSRCELQNGGIIRYTKSFIENRDVTLTGQAFFDVVRNASNPFAVTTGAAIVTVVGTSFNVDASSRDRAEVYVVTGKVRVAANHDQQAEVVVTPGELAIVQNENAIKASSENENPLAWKNHRLVFKGAPLQKVISTMQRYFDVEITIQNQSILKCHFTSTFNDPSLEEVIETLQASLHLNVSKHKNSYVLNGKGCD